MPTLSALMNRSATQSWSLTEEWAASAEVESALIVSGVDLPNVSDIDMEALRRVLVIVPLPWQPSYGWIETVVRCADHGRAAGVVFATGSCGAGSFDFKALTALARRHRMPVLVAPDDPSRVWVQLVKAIREEREHTWNELRDMHRESTRRDGLERLLRRLARQVGGSAVLLDRMGAPVHAFPEIPADVFMQVAAEIERVVTGEIRAAAADFGDGVVHIQSIGAEETGATLVVVRKERFSPAVRNLVADVSRLLALCWRVDDLGRRQRRVDLTETAVREVVLHLLMTGHVQAARRVAGTLAPASPSRSVST